MQSSFLSTRLLDTWKKTNNMELRLGRRYSELPNEFFEACYWMQSRGIPMRVAAELAGIPTSTFHRNYPYWEGYIYDSDGRIIGEKCSKTNKRK